MSDSPYTSIVLTGTPEGEILALWNDFFANAVLPTHYVSPDFFCDPFAGHGRRFAVLVSIGDRVDAVATGTENGTAIRCGLGVRPQAVFRKNVDLAAVGAVLAGALKQGCLTADLIDLHSWGPLDGLRSSGFAHKAASEGDRVIMLDLSKGPEQLFKEFSERRRTDLRKTMKSGDLVVKELETEAELADIYDLHCGWTTRKGVVADPFESFRSVLGSKYRKTFIAIHDGKVIAATFLRFCPGAVVEYAANNSLDGFQKLRPNELLGWRAIEWACSAGFTHFSLGASHPFLARFGGNVIASHRYRLDRTVLKVHVNRERLQNFARQASLSLPDGIRNRIKAARAGGLLTANRR
ncbi:MAG: GNAT family N-acetyltransferase [Pyrinomonadaceae bacterium]|nr:GNAT family N-acetyltransferase [Pyrinomonadaceae bacterium]